MSTPVENVKRVWIIFIYRSDNSIEIWNVEHTPHLEKQIPSSAEGSVEAVVWSNGKLFSTGLHGFVIEYDLVKLTPKASYSVTSGSAWCLAVNKQHTHLAVSSLLIIKTGAEGRNTIAVECHCCRLRLRLDNSPGGG